MAPGSEQIVEHFELPAGNTAWIRKMHFQDIFKVHDLEVEAYQDPWSFSHFRHELIDSQVSWPLIAENELELLGYAIVWFVKDELHIANVATAPAHRRKGIATELLSVIMEEGINRQASRAYLEVRSSNIAAIKLYKKFGFESIGIRSMYYHDGENATLMQRILKGPFHTKLSAPLRK